VLGLGRPARLLARDLVAAFSNDEIGSVLSISPALYKLLPRSSKSWQSLAITAGEGLHS
jgi:hypothetical protein